MDDASHAGDVGTEIAPAAADHPVLAARIDPPAPHLPARSRSHGRRTGRAESRPRRRRRRRRRRKFFNLGAGYDRWRGYRVDPRGLGLHGTPLASREVVRLTQAEVEGHPAWRSFGSQAGRHPPLRGWLATPVCAADGRSYGLLQLSDKAADAEFGPEDGERLVELAAFAGATLDALRAARAAHPV